MTLALIALAVLAIIIFAFVLEPVLRARGDRAVLDAAALPEHDELLDDDEVDAAALDNQAASSLTGDERRRRQRVTIDRPAGSDAS